MRDAPAGRSSPPRSGSRAQLPRVGLRTKQDHHPHCRMGSSDTPVASLFHTRGERDSPGDEPASCPLDPMSQRRVLWTSKAAQARALSCHELGCGLSAATAPR